MKKKNLFFRNFVIVALSAMLFCFSACSDNSITKTDISISIPKDVILKVFDEAAREGVDTTGTPCNVYSFLYIDGWSEEWVQDMHKQKDVPFSNINDIEFDYPEVYVGAEIIARVIVSCGNVSYSGWSEEKILGEEGAELLVTLEKDQRTLAIETNDVTGIEEFDLDSPSVHVDTYGNEYWEFTIPQEAQGYKCTWFLDEELQGDVSNSLKVYKDLLPKGFHSISFAGTNGNKKCTGETSVFINKQSDERFVYICTDEGIEFCVNRLPEDDVFYNLFIQESESLLQVAAEMKNDQRYWSGCWPFVEPGKTYSFELCGEMGALNEGSTDSHWKSKSLPPITYNGNTTSVISDEDLEYISIINNYEHNKKYTLKEVKASGSNEIKQLLFNYKPTEENEIFNLFKESGVDVERIGIEFQLVYFIEVRDEPDNPENTATHLEQWWLTGTGDFMLEAGDRRREFKDYDLMEKFADSNKEEYKAGLARMKELGGSDYEIRLGFYYRVKGRRYQNLKIFGFSEADQRGVKVVRAQ